MEGKKVTKVSISSFFLTLAIIAIIIMGVFIYKLHDEKNIEIKKSDYLQSQINSLNNNVNTLQSKLDTINNSNNNNSASSLNSNSVKEENKTNINETNNSKANNSKTIIAEKSPSGFAGSSLNKVVLYSNGEVYLIKFDGNGEAESNIMSKTLIAKGATSIETCKDEKDENYGSVIVNAKEPLLDENLGWIVFK